MNTAHVHNCSVSPKGGKGGSVFWPTDMKGTPSYGMCGSPALICQKRRGLAAGDMNLVCQTVSLKGFMAALSVWEEKG